MKKDNLKDLPPDILELFECLEKKKRLDDPMSTTNWFTEMQTRLERQDEWFESLKDKEYGEDK